ncbi:unnamed protein product [Orchesella dallaii]|uniref:Uncharacterized protein n=1 Tax=Orchesella dallaii TaxID=48710 RepID=A0ABP1Q4P0_9HEXA
MSNRRGRPRADAAEDEVRAAAANAAPSPERPGVVAGGQLNRTPPPAYPEAAGGNNPLMPPPQVANEQPVLPLAHVQYMLQALIQSQAEQTRELIRVVQGGNAPMQNNPPGPPLLRPAPIHAQGMAPPRAPPQFQFPKRRNRTPQNPHQLARVQARTAKYAANRNAAKHPSQDEKKVEPMQVDHPQPSTSKKPIRLLQLQEKDESYPAPPTPGKDVDESIIDSD